MSNKIIHATIDEIVAIIDNFRARSADFQATDRAMSAIRTALEGLVKDEQDAKSILEKTIKMRGVLDFANYSCVAIPYEDALNAVKLALTAPTPTEKGFYCKEWNKVGYICPEGQCDACKKHEKGGEG